MKFLIEFQKKLDAFLWRPTPKMISCIREAKDEIIAWPADRVVLHTMIDSEKEDNMTNTSSTNKKCKLYDWVKSKELVAEGWLYFRDPNQLMDNILLGQSTVLVLIDELKNQMRSYGDHRLSTKFTSNIKCKLISVHGAKEVIAEGCVSSTNPNEMVHFVPLGEDVVKVWVDIIKIPNAPLWRLTSEFEFIEDAIGSSIAWPSTNINTESTSIMVFGSGLDFMLSSGLYQMFDSVLFGKAFTKS